MPNTNPYPCCGSNAPVQVTPVVPDVCFIWEWDSDDPSSEMLNSIDFIIAGTEDISVLLSAGSPALIAGIEAALNAAGFTYDEVRVEIIPGATTHFIFIIVNPVSSPAGDSLSTADINGNVEFITQDACLGPQIVADPEFDSNCGTWGDHTVGDLWNYTGLQAGANADNVGGQLVVTKDSGYSPSIGVSVSNIYGGWFSGYASPGNVGTNPNVSLGNKTYRVYYDIDTLPAGCTVTFKVGGASSSVISAAGQGVAEFTGNTTSAQRQCEVQINFPSGTVADVIINYFYAYEVL